LHPDLLEVRVGGDVEEGLARWVFNEPIT